IIDGHEDLAINALADGRDYLTSARSIRQAEIAAGFENPCGLCMLGLEDWIRGRVALIVTTITAIPQEHALPGEMTYPTIEVAREQVMAQLDLYRRWSETHPQIELVRDASQFDAVLESWGDLNAPDTARRVGLMLLMENADPIRDPGEIEWWAEQG